MSDRIQTLVKRITETRPVQSARRQTLLDEMRALRMDLDAQSVPDQAHSLDAALLLMEFMGRSQEVATTETLQIVASLVGTIDEHCLRASRSTATPAPRPAPRPVDVSEHRDLRMTQEFLLGTILLQAGVLSGEALARGLHLHASSRLALGQCLIQLGHATPEQIAGAVAYQDRLRERVLRPAAEQPAPEPLGTENGSEGNAPAKLELRLSSQQKGCVHSIHAQVLGEILIRQGTVTREQLESALRLQRAAGLHVGEALVQSGATSWEQIKKALEIQRGMRRSA